MSYQYWLVSVVTEQGSQVAFCTLSHLKGDMLRVTRENAVNATGQAVRCDKRSETTYGRVIHRISK